MRISPKLSKYQNNPNSLNSQGTRPSLFSKTKFDDYSSGTDDYQINDYTRTSAFETYYFTNNQETSHQGEPKQKTMKNGENLFTIEKFKQANFKAKKVLQNILTQRKKFHDMKEKQSSKLLTDGVPAKIKQKASKQKYIKGINSKKNRYSQEIVDKVHKQSDNQRKFSRNKIKSKSLEKRKRLKTEDTNKKFNRSNSVYQVSKIKSKYSKMENQKQKGPAKKRQNKRIQKDKRNKIKQHQTPYLKSIKKICSIISVYRETCQLACYYFEKVSQSLYVFKDKQILIFSVILLALKISDSSMGQKFLNEIGRFKEPHLFAQRRSLSLESTLTKSKKEVFLEKFNDKKKAKNRLSKYLKNMPIFLSKYEGYIPKKQEILGMEIYICKQLQFKLTYETLSSAIDDITFSWDDYIMNNFKKNENTLVIRSCSENKKFSHLLQIMELFSYLNPEKDYFMSAISTLYLIIRIALENRKKSSYWESIRRLKSSQNFIFTDKTGANEIFFGFVQIWNIQFQELMKYCNEIIPLFQNKNIKVFDFSYSDTICFDQSLSVYQYNQGLFQV